VALTLMGILGASIAGVLQNSTESIEQGTRAMDNLTRFRSLEVVLGTALRDAQDREVSTTERRMMTSDGSYDPADGKYRFRGEEQALAFCLQRPFLGTEYDGYMHWVTLEIREDDETERFSLWLRDVSYLREIDNPVGDDWGESNMPAEEWLPTRELCLLKDADLLIFRYWELDTGEVSGEPEPMEMESEEIEGDYARTLPDFVELEVSMPKKEPESLYFDYCIRRKGI
jgi:hypothetical protein